MIRKMRCDTVLTPKETKQQHNYVAKTKKANQGSKEVRVREIQFQFAKTTMWRASMTFSPSFAWLSFDSGANMNPNNI